MIDKDSRTQDDAAAEPFDQTNDMVEGLDGESDGTAGSDVQSGEERQDEGTANPGDDSAGFFQRQPI